MFLLVRFHCEPFNKNNIPCFQFVFPTSAPEISMAEEPGPTEHGLTYFCFVEITAYWWCDNHICVKFLFKSMASNSFEEEKKSISCPKTF